MWLSLICSCKAVENEAISSCTNEYDRDKARIKCEILLDQNGPFAGCHIIMDPVAFVSSCIVDVCLESELLCKALDTYAKVCDESMDSPIMWRTASFCGRLASFISHWTWGLLLHQSYMNQTEFFRITQIYTCTCPKNPQKTRYLMFCLSNVNQFNVSI